jgi:hypothetical protein
MPEILRVTDETTADDLRECLANLCHSAKRCIPVVGNDLLPTEWDRRHARIDALLDELQQATA